MLEKKIEKIEELEMNGNPRCDDDVIVNIGNRNANGLIAWEVVKLKCTMHPTGKNSRKIVPI